MLMNFPEWSDLHMETQSDLWECCGSLHTVAASHLLKEWPSLMVFGPINPLIPQTASLPWHPWTIPVLAPTGSSSSSAALVLHKGSREKSNLQYCVPFNFHLRIVLTVFLLCLTVSILNKFCVTKPFLSFFLFLELCLVSVGDWNGWLYPPLVQHNLYLKILFELYSGSSVTPWYVSFQSHSSNVHITVLWPGKDFFFF